MRLAAANRRKLGLQREQPTGPEPCFEGSALMLQHRAEARCRSSGNPVWRTVKRGFYYLIESSVESLVLWYLEAIPAL